MDNEQKEVETTETEEVETTETETAETADSKVKLTDEEKLARLEGGAKRLRKKLGLDEAPVKKEEVKKVENKKSDETDYALEAYLVAQGIKEDDERELFNERVRDTGKSAKEVLGNKYFQQDLQGLRDAKAVKAATPSGSNRSGSPASNTVDYWKAKIDSGQATVLDIPDVKLRRQVVNSKLEQHKNVNHFTDNPFGEIGLRKK